MKPSFVFLQLFFIILMKRLKLQQGADLWANREKRQWAGGQKDLMTGDGSGCHGKPAPISHLWASTQSEHWPPEQERPSGKRPDGSTHCGHLSHQTLAPSQPLCRWYRFLSVADFFFFCIKSRPIRISISNELPLGYCAWLSFNVNVSDDSKGLKQEMSRNLLLHETSHTFEIQSKAHQINGGSNILKTLNN